MHYSLTDSKHSIGIIFWCAELLYSVSVTHAFKYYTYKSTHKVCTKYCR
jgi:hypothetical protein